MSRQIKTKMPSIFVIPTRDHDHLRNTTQVWWTTMKDGRPTHYRHGSIAVSDPSLT